MARSYKPLHTKSFTQFAAYLVNVPYEGGPTNTFKGPKERNDWLQALLDIYYEENNKKKKHKKKALEDAGVKEEGNDYKDRTKLLEALDAIYKIRGIPAGSTTEISLWRYIYEKLGERFAAARNVGRHEIGTRLADILTAHPNGDIPRNEIDAIVNHYNFKPAAKQAELINTPDDEFGGLPPEKQEDVIFFRRLEFNSSMSEVGY